MAPHKIRRPRTLVVSAAMVMAAGVFGGGVAAGRSWVDGPVAPALQHRGVQAGPSPSPPVPAQPSLTKPRVVVYGDSLVTQSEPYLAIVGKALGLTVTSRAFYGIAPCDLLPKLRLDLAAHTADLVVWAFSGNSIGTCMLDDLGHPLVGAAVLARYRSDTEAAIAASTKAHVLFVLASPPAPGTVGDIWNQLDTVYREVAAGHPEIQYADAGVAIASDGRFVVMQRCLPFEARIPQAGQACSTASGAITVRGPDHVHFCAGPSVTDCTAYSSGAMRYAINLLGAARLELDFEAQATATRLSSP